MNGNPNAWDQASLPWYAWAAIAVLLLAQGTWLFTDARKRGKLPWFWGIWGLLHFPLPLLAYVVFVRLGFRFGSVSAKAERKSARNRKNNPENGEELP